MSTQNLQALLKFLIHSPLDFILIGGFAAVLHGSNHTTRDIDLCMLFSPEQISQLRTILAPLHPRHRMTTDKLSFLEHPQDTTRLANLYLETDLGVIDLVSEVKTIGTYPDVLKHAKNIELFGGICKVIGLNDLIQCKLALGRRHDLVVAHELQAIQKELGFPG